MLILAISMAIASYLFIAQPFGGGSNLVQFAGTSLGVRTATFTQYNQWAGTHTLIAKITGVHTVNRSPMAGNYWAIGQESGEFILVAQDGATYRTGTSGQIIADSIKFERGEPNQVSVEVLSFDDELITDKLNELQSQHPGAAIFLAGNIRVDFPEDLSPKFDPLKLPTLAVSGSSVNLIYHPIDKALIDLDDQYAIGNLQARIFSKRPEGY